MDSPSGVPDAPSPVVLLPRNDQHVWPELPSAGTGMVAARNLTQSRNLRTTRSMGPVLSSDPSHTAAFNQFTNSLLAHVDTIRPHGPTTRSRRRTTQRQLPASQRSLPIEPPGDIAALSAPPLAPRVLGSRKRKASSSPAPTARRRSSNRKKPPPGVCLKKPPARALNHDDSGEQKPEPCVENCCICMCDVERNDLAQISGCEHRFCFECIEKWAERENTCPLCKKRFTKIERVNKKRKKGTKNSKKVKQRDQRSDLPQGSGLEGLIANLQRTSGFARLILGVTSGMPQVTTTTHEGYSPFSPMNRNDDDSDDDSPMAAFMRAFHGGQAATNIRMSTTVVRPMTVTASYTRTTTTTHYARNFNDVTAGNDIENPLEIDDDVSVDEVIEIE